MLNSESFVVISDYGAIKRAADIEHVLEAPLTLQLCQFIVLVVF